MTHQQLWKIRLATALIAGGIAWMLPLPGYDAVFDWLATDAALTGNPYAPMGTIAAEAGLDTYPFAPHPRLPGALLLQLPILLVPLHWMQDLGPALAAAAIVWTLLYLRSQWWVWMLVAAPAWNAILYGQASSLVTLLLAVWLVRQSGAALGAAAVLRVWPGYVMAWLLVSRRWREAGVAAGVMIGLNVAGLFLPGVTVERMVNGFGGSTAWLDSPENLVKDVPLWLMILCGTLGLFAARVRDARWAVAIGVFLSPAVWLHYLTALAVAVAPRVKRNPAAHVIGNSVVDRAIDQGRAHRSGP